MDEQKPASRRWWLRTLLVGTVLIGLTTAIVMISLGPRGVMQLIHMASVKAQGAATVDDRIEEFGESVEQRLAPHFEEAGVSYPPQKVLMVGLKQEERLEIYAADTDGELTFIRDYPVLAASGTLGPKLRQGDRQVPEGIYTIDALNPNSRFHLSLRVNYPNPFDQRKADAEGRDDPGDNIFIHGSAVSIGCLAMGDDVAEELFVLAALTGVENVDLILSPVDFRSTDVPESAIEEMPPWIGEVYEEIRAAMAELPER